jgi:hypothetical protein
MRRPWESSHHSDGHGRLFVQNNLPGAPYGTWLLGEQFGQYWAGL